MRQNISRGNVLGLTVAVVTAQEFGTVVTAPVGDFGSALLAAQSRGAYHRWHLFSVYSDGRAWMRSYGVDATTPTIGGRREGFYRFEVGRVEPPLNPS